MTDPPTYLIRVCKHGYRVERLFDSGGGWRHMDAWPVAEVYCDDEEPAVVTVTPLATVVRELESAYHPQTNKSNPVPHPADLITKRFKLEGHEGLDL